MPLVARHGRDRPVEDVDRGCGERMARAMSRDAAMGLGL